LEFDVAQNALSIELAYASKAEAVIHPGLQHIDMDGISRSKVFLHGAREIPFHWHREMEILIILKGSAKIVVESRLCLMREGDLMIINAHEAHNSVSLSAETVICGVHLDPAHYERLGLTGFSERSFYCRSFLHGKSFDKISRTIKAFVARMILTDQEQPAEIAIHAAMATALACCIYKSVPWTKFDRNDIDKNRGGRERILRVIDRLSRAYRTPALSELAEAEGVSLAHLSRLFRAHTGVTFRQYAQGVKLDVIMEDLLTSDETVSSIMEARGIGNPSLFFNRFRERFGCSPAKFREHGLTTGTVHELPNDIQTGALNSLLQHLEHLPIASELTFGLSAISNRKVAVSAFHSFPTTRAR
jgi:AraC-like DNA-binding protein/mannose-6-phosphate isomerase-like protein (cupin superfamily)